MHAHCCHAARCPAGAPWLAEIEYFVKASLPQEAQEVRAAMCKLFRLSASGGMGMMRANVERIHEERLVLVETIDTKMVVARPPAEPGVAYFLPYSHVSGMR